MVDKCAIAILIPVYNGGEFIEGCFDSILAQTFPHYKVLLYDDGSLDGSQQVCQDYVMEHPDKFQGMENWEFKGKRWNGGARNDLMKNCPDAEYVLFMDCDDKFVDNTVLQRVYDFTLEQGCPDVVRLGYTKKNPDGGIITKILRDSSPEEMAVSTKVAPWTKLVKKKILEKVSFPENTLFEDVVHHLLLSDIVETVAAVDFPVIEWNRCNANSASTLISPKRRSSAFRFVADLMDVELSQPYTQARREVKVRDAANNLGIDFDNIDWKKVCC